jgi:amino acid transporter
LTLSLSGWYCVLGWQAGIAGQCTTVAFQIIGMIALNNEQYMENDFREWHVVLLTIAVVTVAVVFNSFFARKLPLVEGLVLVLHVCGFFAILIPLWVFAPRNSSLDVWTNFSQLEDPQNPGGTWSSIGLACLVGLSSSIYALIGPDSCVHMGKSPDTPFCPRGVSTSESLLTPSQPKKSKMRPAPSHGLWYPPSSSTA